MLNNAVARKVQPAYNGAFFSINFHLTVIITSTWNTAWYWAASRNSENVATCVHHIVTMEYEFPVSFFPSFVFYFPFPFYISVLLSNLHKFYRRYILLLVAGLFLLKKCRNHNMELKCMNRKQ